MLEELSLQGRIRTHPRKVRAVSRQRVMLWPDTADMAGTCLVVAASANEIV